MKRINWKWMLLAGCAVLLILATVLGVWQWRRTYYQDLPFGLKYSVVSTFFVLGDVQVFDSETPEFALSQEGYLLDIAGSDFGRLSGALRKFSPSKENFDDIFHGEGKWRVTGLDAVSARQENAKAWKYEKMNGTFYYVMLQNNGDVFLCVGQDGAICQFYWLQPLEKY